MVVRDSFGQRIKPGVVITYPVRNGSDMWMSTAVVENVEVPCSGIGAGLTVAVKSGRKTTVFAIERVTVLPHVDSQDLIETWKGK